MLFSDRRPGFLPVTYDLHCQTWPNSVNVKRRAKYLGQRSFGAKDIVQAYN